MQKTLTIFALLLTCTMMYASFAFSKSPEYYFAEGERFFETKDFHSAIGNYSKAINLKSDYLRAYYKRGLARVQMDSNVVAIRDFDVVISISPNGEAYYQRGCAEFELKDSVNACSDWSKACDYMVNKACLIMLGGKCPN